MEGPFWAMEGRWKCHRGSTNLCLRFDGGLFSKFKILPSARRWFIACANVFDLIVPTVNSIRLAYSCESGDAPSHGRYAQTDLVGSHWAVPIKGFARGRGPDASSPAQCEENRRSGSLLAILIV